MQYLTNGVKFTTITQLFITNKVNKTYLEHQISVNSSLCCIIILLNFLGLNFYFKHLCHFEHSLYLGSNFQVDFYSKNIGYSLSLFSNFTKNIKIS